MNLGLNEIQNILIGNPLFSLDKIRNYNKSIVKEGILFEYDTKAFSGSFLFDNSMKNLIDTYTYSLFFRQDLSKAIKGKTKINKELLRMSRIMNT